MNTLKGRVLIVLRGAGQPLSAPQIARILGINAQVVASPLSRLSVYGLIEKIGDEPGSWRRRRGLYRIKEAS